MQKTDESFKIVGNGKGKTLQISMPLVDGQLSASGKSYTLASTGGFVEVPGTDVKINVVAIRKVR